MAVNRRGFLLAAAAAFTIDPDRLLWRPGEKHFSIPKPAAVRMAYSTPICFDYYTIDWPFRTPQWYIGQVIPDSVVETWRHGQLALDT